MYNDGGTVVWKSLISTIRSGTDFNSQFLKNYVCHDARFLEGEGMERTHKFKQEDIAQAVPVASSSQVSKGRIG